MTRLFTGRTLLLVTVLAGWVALVVVGAGERVANTDRFAVPDLRDAFTAFMVVFFLCCLISLPFILSIQKGKREPRRAQSLRSLIILFAVAVVLTYVLDLQNLGGVATVGEPAPPLPEGDGDVQTVSDQTRNSLAALVAMGAIAVAVLVWTRRRLVQVPGTTSQPALESDIAPALDIATSHLLEGSDPRTSVLAAYASLESSLAKQGRQRELSETPTEHLARVLRELPQVSGPAVQLGRLYELARFSDHSITREDQLAAAQALDRARQDLRASSVVES